MTDMSYKFNWHEEPERGFMQCIWLSLMSGSNRDELMETTQGGRSITLRIFANDVEVNTRAMLESLDMNYQYHWREEVAEKLKEIRFEELEEKIRDVEKDITAELKRRLTELGIELNHADDVDW